jgi:tetratricopeptide (TPR) repeat protein
MMVFDWLLVALPVAFSAMVFGLALGTEPIDLSLHEVTSPSSLVDRGFEPGTIDDLLERKITAIVEAAGSDRETGKIDIGTSDTAINAYAEIVNVEAPVRATQRLLDMVEYIAETHFLIAGDQDVVAGLHIMDSNTLETVQYKEYKYPPEDFNELLDEIASDIVNFLDPYILVVYMYKNAIKINPTEKYADVIKQVQSQMAIAKPSIIPWYYGLLGQIAEKVGDPETAIEYYQAALELDEGFYLGHVNWGRLLFNQDKISEALEQYVAALRINPLVPSTNLSIAQALLAQDQFQDAFTALARAGQLAPNFADVYETRADVFERLGLPELAKQQRARAEVARAREPNQNLYDTL